MNRRCLFMVYAALLTASPSFLRSLFPFHSSQPILVETLSSVRVFNCISSFVYCFFKLWLPIHLFPSCISILPMSLSLLMCLHIDKHVIGSAYTTFNDLGNSTCFVSTSSNWVSREDFLMKFDWSVLDEEIMRYMYIINESIVPICVKRKRFLSFLRSHCI